MTVKTKRWLQPDTPTVYSPRCTPPTHGPTMAGWTISLERTSPVAVGQFSSNCPRVTAVLTAIPCLLSRNWAGVTQPAMTSPDNDHADARPRRLPLLIAASFSVLGDCTVPRSDHAPPIP